MHKPAAIYTRVSSDRQKEDHTIASQTAALIEYAQTHGYRVDYRHIIDWLVRKTGS
jgi:DNA invertase Pin-like site-specific DNA recombinase